MIAGPMALPPALVVVEGSEERGSDGPTLMVSMEWDQTSAWPVDLWVSAHLSRGETREGPRWCLTGRVESWPDEDQETLAEVTSRRPRTQSLAGDLVSAW